MSIVPVQASRYQPTFDPENGSYRDECPIPSYTAKGRLRYICPCNNQTLSSHSEFKMHFSRKYHQRYLENYGDRISDLAEAQALIKSFQVKCELLHRKEKELLAKIESQDKLILERNQLIHRLSQASV
jgi:hypothetical protein